MPTLPVTWEQIPRRGEASTAVLKTVMTHGIAQDMSHHTTTNNPPKTALMTWRTPSKPTRNHRQHHHLPPTQRTGGKEVICAGTADSRLAPQSHFQKIAGLWDQVTVLRSRQPKTNTTMLTTWFKPFPKNYLPGSLWIRNGPNILQASRFLTR